uniref:NADH-ubiquinone oxidoreductase chain 2 n=1 Tax=Coleoptera sp. 3 AH-2016 TaxID=1903825 RepID=A0A343C4I9_9COLE|nr:NADH dehydrogenase subunit 2 [Coleoptera sp. 3 AH-2016]
MKNLYKLLFFNLLIMSTLIAISSLSWMTIWISLEMNLLAIMPLMKNIKNKYSAESTIKYFIIQAMASAMLLFSIIIYLMTKTINMNLFTYSSILTDSALFMKMGAAPFHFWLPEIISGMNWEMIFIILTWQKIAPMILLSYSIYTPMFLSIIIIISSMISGIQGMNQNCLRKIMAYSSINHTGWMIAAIMSSLNIWFYYFIIYSIINLNILLILNKYQIFYLNQLSKLFSYNKYKKFFFMLNFLSLGGLPPFLGFLPKWMTINFLISENFYTLSFLLIIFTLMSLYFYMRITFTTFTLNSTESLTNIIIKVNYLHFFVNFVSLSSLLLMFCLANFL